MNAPLCFVVESTGRSYSLHHLSSWGIIQKATHLSIHHIYESTIINTGYEKIMHSYEELQELASIILQHYNKEIYRRDDPMNTDEFKKQFPGLLETAGCLPKEGEHPELKFATIEGTLPVTNVEPIITAEINQGHPTTIETNFINITRDNIPVSEVNVITGEVTISTTDQSALPHHLKMPTFTSKVMYDRVIEENLTYGQAMDKCIHERKKVSRAVWGGYWFVPDSTPTVGEPLHPYKDSLNNHNFFLNDMVVACLKNEGGYVPATPYAEDMFAKDWRVVE